jgi:hypothetical protein
MIMPSMAAVDAGGSPPDLARAAQHECHPPSRSTTRTALVGVLLRRVGPVLLLLLLLSTYMLVLITGAAWYWYDTFVVAAVRDLARTADFAAVRRTDATYYLRHCSSADMIMYRRDDDDDDHDKRRRRQYPQQQRDNNGLEIRHEDDIADHMMQNGVGMFHQLASPNTTARLRRYLLKRNLLVNGTAEEMEMNPSQHRIAYALDPSDHVVVADFLAELTRHKLLHATLRFLTGDADPALTELAVLTSYPGAATQRWHHDVITGHGSAIQFGRTYAHTYSMFVALQDTTAAMGGTQVCPGSHYCGSSQQLLCQRHGFTPPHWRAGTGVLFNQQLAHKGNEHQLNQPIPRVMLVISFALRPDLHLDGRVLSAGLYCFAHWRIFGLTWNDLTRRPQQSWQQRWYMHNSLLRSLRSLGVWKPPGHGRHWGLDYVTKQILEWNLAENGMELESLAATAVALQKFIRFPRFLQGQVYVVGYDDDGGHHHDKPAFDIYHRYFCTTLSNLWRFSLLVHGLVVLGGVAVVFGAFVVARRQQRQRQLLPRQFRRAIVLIYVIPSILILWGFRTVQRRSLLVRNLGRLYRVPFAPHIVSHSIGGDGATDDWSSSAPHDPITTVPERTDVLIGTRLNAAHLGSMNVWLDYHPGNFLFRRTITRLAQYAKLLPSPLLCSTVLTDVRGRFLLQEWRTGNWLVQDEIATAELIEQELQKLSDPLLATFSAAMDQRLAFYRFDVSYRSSSLASLTMSAIADVRGQLFGRAKPKTQTALISKQMEPSSPLFHAQCKSKVLKRPNRVDQSATWIKAPDRSKSPLFHIGEIVVTIKNDKPSRASILDVRIDDHNGTIMYDLGNERGDDDERGAQEHSLFAMHPLVSGRTIHCRFHKHTDVWSPVMVRTVRPDGYIDIQFSDPSGNGQQLWAMDVKSAKHCRWSIGQGRGAE